MESGAPRLLDRLRGALAMRRYSPRTQDAYVGWVRRFILFHGKRHPLVMGADEVNAFLTSLAVDARVAAATQNQALCAIVFLYRVVLESPLPWLDDLVRAQRPVRFVTALRDLYFIASRSAPVSGRPLGAYSHVDLCLNSY